MKSVIARTLREQILYAAWLSASAGKYDLCRRWLALLEIPSWT